MYYNLGVVTTSPEESTGGKLPSGDREYSSLLLCKRLSLNFSMMLAVIDTLVTTY